MIDVLESVAKLLFAPKKPNAQKQRFHIVRCLAELRVHQVKSLGFILLLVQDLIGLLEVVIVFSLVFLAYTLPLRTVSNTADSRVRIRFMMRES